CFIYLVGNCPDANQRQVFINCLKCMANGWNYPAWPANRPDNEVDLAKPSWRRLSVRNVENRKRLFAPQVASHVPHDAYYLNFAPALQLIKAEFFNRQYSTNRVLIGKGLPGHGFVDYRHSGRLLSVGLSEFPALKERYSHCLEETRPDRTAAPSHDVSRQA